MDIPRDGPPTLPPSAPSPQDGARGVFSFLTGAMKELFKTALAMSTFVMVIFCVSNIPQVLALIQVLFIKAFRLDGGSKRSRLEAKVKAAREAATAGGAAAGRDSLGVSESTVTARWVDDDEDDDEEDDEE